MGLMDKIEEIRKKPDHIRMRYVWFFVTLSMLFVIILWIFSLKALKSESQRAPTENNFSSSNILNEFSQQQETLNDARKNAENSLLNNSASNPVVPSDGTQSNQTQNNSTNENGQ
jgi:uncharacterized protein YlxW (UPF0749 family)